MIHLSDQLNAPAYSPKTMIVEHAAVSAIVLTGGDAGAFGIALSLEGHANKTGRSKEASVVIPAGILGDIIAELAYHGSAASREFVSELEAAVRAGQERLRREGAPR